MFTVYDFQFFGSKLIDYNHSDIRKHIIRTKFTICRDCLYTLGEIVIPCLLSLCFDDAMHGIYASYFVNMGFRVISSGIYV